MTEIYVYCPICNKEDGKEVYVSKMIVVNGCVTFELDCGHKINERFNYPSQRK